MPRVHNLFYSTDCEKRTLHRNICPSEKQQEMQQDRWNDLCEYLTDDLGEISGCKIYSWLQGSYRFGTQVRPAHKKDEFDIDLGIYFVWEGNSGGGKFSPDELKSLVQSSLLRYKEEAGDDVLEVVSPPKERCSRIRFSENFHIDVPSYHLEEKKDFRILATENYGWEYSDPKAFYVWFRSIFSDEENSQVRRIIRYLKIWAQLNMKQAPASVLLTVLVAEAYALLTEEQVDGDDMALRNIAVCVAGRLEKDSDVRNPVNKSESLNRAPDEETLEFIEKLRILVGYADEALATSTEIEAASIWSSVFHHFFPFPAPDPSDLNSRSLVPVKFVPEVSVVAIPEENIHLPYKGHNRIGPIPKKCEIKFILENSANLPSGASVRWIVRNEADEADFENDLGHLAGTGFRGREHSSYKGVHFMDVSISSALGEILGFRRIPVEVGEQFVPLRNPRKPGWVRLNSRRR